LHASDPQPSQVCGLFGCSQGLDSGLGWLPSSEKAGPPTADHRKPGFPDDAKKLDGIPEAIKKGIGGEKAWREEYDADDEEWSPGEKTEKKEKSGRSMGAVSGTRERREGAVSGTRERMEGAVSGTRERREGAMSGTSVSGAGAVSGASDKNEKIEKNAKIEKKEKTEKNGRITRAVSGVRSRSAVSGGSMASAVSGVGDKIEKVDKTEKVGKNEKIEENVKIEKKEETEKNRGIQSAVRGMGGRIAVSGAGGRSPVSSAGAKNVGATSGARKRIGKLSGSGNITRETARGRAGHVGLQGGSTGPIPLFPLDEVIIRPDSGDQEAPRCLEPSDAYWTRLSRTERPSKGPRIRPTFGMATEDRPLPFPTDRRITRREVQDAPDLGTLETWASQVGLTVGAVADTEAKRKKALELCWTYRDMDSAGLDTLRVTDLVMHTVTVREGAKPYAGGSH